MEKNMSGVNKGFVGKIKTKLIDNKFEMSIDFHCNIHQEHYVTKSSLGNMSYINYIRKHELDHRQLQ